MSFQRQDRPVRSGRSPGGAACRVKRPAFIARSAQARPPPENIAYDTCFDGPKRATLAVKPCSLTAATGTRAVRSVRSSSSRAHAAVAARTAEAVERSHAGTAKLAPSPPKTNGNLRPGSALPIPEITEAPAVFTDL